MYFLVVRKVISVHYSLSSPFEYTRLRGVPRKSFIMSVCLYSVLHGMLSRKQSELLSPFTRYRS